MNSCALTFVLLVFFPKSIIKHSLLKLTCDGNSVVPRNGFGLVNYPWVANTSWIFAFLNKIFIRAGLGPNQACTLLGAQRGNDIISGSAYIFASYGIDTRDLWRRNLPVLIGFFILFQVTQILTLEFYPVSALNLFGKKVGWIWEAIRAGSSYQYLCERRWRNKETKCRFAREETAKGPWTRKRSDCPPQKVSHSF